MNTYEIGQIFEGTYPPDAATWCDENGVFIMELEPRRSKRIFQIRAIPAMPLEEVKDAKITELKNERAKREEAPVEYCGKMWDFDAISRERIMATVTALEVGRVATIEWSAHDNTSSTLTATDLKSIVAVAALRGDALHKKYRKLRDAVNLAKTAAKVKAISWVD